MRALVLAFGCVLTGFSSFAGVQAPEIDLICVTEFPTTSFVIKQNDDRVSVKVIHHNGVQYMPVWNGLITPSDIPTIQNAADVLAKLGTEINIEWKTAGCKVQAADDFNCFGSAKTFEVNGVEVAPWALMSSKISEKSLYGTFEKTNLSLHVEIDKKSYVISMDYGTKDCFAASQLTKK